MSNPVQLALFTETKKRNQSIIANKKEKKSEWGTFRDSLNAPVHRWFTYPAGFSYKAVEHSLKRYSLTCGQTIYDPFMGSGTTNLVAKTHGLNSFGVEAHPFVFRIAQAKMHWEIDTQDANQRIHDIYAQISDVSQQLQQELVLVDEFPELIMKCYQEKHYTIFGPYAKLFYRRCFILVIMVFSLW